MRVQPHPAAATALVVALAAFLAIAASGRANASGALDQYLTGDPACPGEFAGFVSTLGTLQQEFVPQMAALDGVDVCVQTFADYGPAVDITVRRGTVGNGGEIIAATSIDGTEESAWRHIDFDSIAVTPGESLLLEVTGYFSWKETCAEIIGSCDHVDGDLYPPGRGYQEDNDFFFRTYGSGGPGNEPGPPPLTLQWGNLDCNGGLFPDDALVLVAMAAGVEPSIGQSGGCPDIGQLVSVFGRERKWGDVDCLDHGPLMDALALLLVNAGSYLPYDMDTACPHPNLLVNVRLLS